MGNRKRTAPPLRKRYEWFMPWAELGYSIELGGSGHLHVLDPAGQRVTVASATPSDHRSVKNTVAALRRHDRERAGGSALGGAPAPVVPPREQLRWPEGRPPKDVARRAWVSLDRVRCRQKPPPTETVLEKVFDVAARLAGGGVVAGVAVDSPMDRLEALFAAEWEKWSLL